MWPLALGCMASFDAYGSREGTYNKIACVHVGHIPPQPWQTESLMVHAPVSAMLHDMVHPRHWTSDLCTYRVSGDLWEDHSRINRTLPGARNLRVVCPYGTHIELFPPYARNFRLASRYFVGWPNFAILRSHGDAAIFATGTHDARGMMRPCTWNHRACNSAADTMLLNVSNLKAYVSVNELAVHAKLTSIPIGIQWHMRNALATFRHQLVANDRRARGLLLINFGDPGFYTEETDCVTGNLTRHACQVCIKCRASIRNHISMWPFATVIWDTKQCPESYYTIVSSFTFFFSPPGTGWDCYRTWEALYLGTIPVILSGGEAADSMYSDLPVLIVQKYSDVTEALLHSTLHAFRKRRFDWSKLTISYWHSLVKKTLLNATLD